MRASEFLPEAAIRPTTSTRYERFEDCIECGLCLSACPVAATDDTYVGPAALAYAQRLLEEPRAAPTATRSSTGPTSDAGAWRCHAAFECTEACPSDVRPAQRIMALRKELGDTAGTRAVEVRIAEARTGDASEIERGSSATRPGVAGPRAAQGRSAAAGRAGSTSAAASIGSFAFSLNRVTGLGLVFYLYLHLAVLSMLLRGEERVERLPRGRDDAAVPAASTCSWSSGCSPTG